MQKAMKRLRAIIKNQKKKNIMPRKSFFMDLMQEAT